LEKEKEGEGMNVQLLILKPGVYILILLLIGIVIFIWFWVLYCKNKIKIVTFTGPSGAGKTTIVRELLKRHPEWKMIVSLTSREPRCGEDGDLPGEYRCNVSKKEFLRIRKAGEDLWIESAHGNMYATLKTDVLNALSSKGLSLMQILPVSIPKIREYVPGRVLSIFVLPPGEEELRRRLEKRGESPEQIEKRIADCRKWEEEARSSGIPYEFIRNDGTIAEAVEKIEQIINKYL